MVSPRRLQLIWVWTLEPRSVLLLLTLMLEALVCFHNPNLFTICQGFFFFFKLKSNVDTVVHWPISIFLVLVLHSTRAVLLDRLSKNVFRSPEISLLSDLISWSYRILSRSAGTIFCWVLDKTDAFTYVEGDKSGINILPGWGCCLLT